MSHTSTLPRYLTSKQQLLDLTAASSAGHCLAPPPPPHWPPPSSSLESLRRKLERKLRRSFSIPGRPRFSLNSTMSLPAVLLF